MGMSAAEDILGPLTEGWRCSGAGVRRRGYVLPATYIQSHLMPHVAALNTRRSDALPALITFGYFVPTICNKLPTADIFTQ